jgi:hypothetical protein
MARDESKERLFGYKDSQMSQLRGPKPSMYSGISSNDNSHKRSGLNDIYNKRKELMMNQPGSLAARYHEQMQGRELGYNLIL